MTGVPSPDEQLLTVRRAADRMLSLLLVLHLPAAFGLAALHGTWIAAVVVGGGVSAGAYFLVQRAPGAFSTRLFIALGLMTYSALFISQSHGLIEMHFHIFGALAEFERELIRERTRAGLAAARARGRQGGRPRKLDTERKIKMAQSLYNEGTHSIDDICQMLGISRATLYRAITPHAEYVRDHE